MIVFCEDCGKKNDATDDQLKDNRAVFTCTHCGYRNSYVFTNRPSITEILERFMNRVDSFSQIDGILAFHPEHGLFNHMPAALKPTDIKHLLSALTKGYLSFQSVYEDPRELIVKISKKYLTIKIINGKWVILILSNMLPLSEDFRSTLNHALIMLGDPCHGT